MSIIVLVISILGLLGYYFFERENIRIESQGYIIGNELYASLLIKKAGREALKRPVAEDNSVTNDITEVVEEIETESQI